MLFTSASISYPQCSAALSTYWVGPAGSHVARKNSFSCSAPICYPIVLHNVKARQFVGKLPESSFQDT